MAWDAEPTAPALQPHELADLAAELEALALWPGHGEAIMDALGSGRSVGFIAGPAGSGWARAVAIVAERWSRVLGLPIFGIAATRYTAHELQSILGTQCVATAALRPEQTFEPGCLVVWHESNLVTDDQVDAVQNGVRKAGGKLLLVSAAG